MTVIGGSVRVSLTNIAVTDDLITFHVNAPKRSADIAAGTLAAWRVAIGNTGNAGRPIGIDGANAELVVPLADRAVIEVITVPYGHTIRPTPIDHRGRRAHRAFGSFHCARHCGGAAFVAWHAARMDAPLGCAILGTAIANHLWPASDRNERRKSIVAKFVPFMAPVAPARGACKALASAIAPNRRFYASEVWKARVILFPVDAELTRPRADIAKLRFSASPEPDAVVVAQVVACLETHTGPPASIHDRRRGLRRALGSFTVARHLSRKALLRINAPRRDAALWPLAVQVLKAR